MNNFLSQIKYFQRHKRSFKDPLLHTTQIQSIKTCEKFKIIFAERLGQTWKYCLAPIVFNSVLYTFLEIKLTNGNQLNTSPIFSVSVEILLETLKQPQQQIFLKCSKAELALIINSISSFSQNRLGCSIKNSQENERSKKLRFNFIVTKQLKFATYKIIKASFLLLQLIVDRMRLYLKVKEARIEHSNSHINSLRFSISSSIKTQIFQKKITLQQAYENIKSQQRQVEKHCSIIDFSFKGILNILNTVNLSFTQNLQKRNHLHQQYLKEEERRKSQIKKEKIYSNIEIVKQQSVGNFFLQTKFSIITQCTLIFKIIQTHINRKQDYSKSTQNIEYFNYLVDITKTQQKVCVRKRPLQPEIQYNKTIGTKIDLNQVALNEAKQKTKRILKTEKNCLDIMKDSWVANICPYYVHYKEQDTLYSKLYKMSLDDWRQSNLPCRDQVLIDLFLQILNGLFQMRVYNIIHRDLKPDNILIDASNPLRPIVKLIDFGSTIFLHSDCQKYEQKVHQNFDTKLRTTKAYNMDLNEFKKFCMTYIPQHVYKYNESTYNRHAKFDIYSVGKIMEEFKGKFKNEKVLENIEFLIRLCTCPDPEFRLDLQETALFLTTLKNFYFTS